MSNVTPKRTVLENKILANARHNTMNPNIMESIIVEQQEFEPIMEMIDSDFRPHIDRVIKEMSIGIDYAFWYYNNYIRFEG
jgi:hypothetical protein